MPPVRLPAAIAGSTVAKMIGMPAAQARLLAGRHTQA
jgi:hypothetical protein